MTIQVRESGALRFPALAMRGNAVSQVEFDALEAEIIAAREGEATLDAKLDVMETATAAVASEVTTARSGSASLDARIDAIAATAGGAVPTGVFNVLQADVDVIEARMIYRLVVDAGASSSIAYVATTSPVITTFGADTHLRFVPSVDNGANPTLTINGVGPAPLLTASGSPPPDGYFQSGNNYLLIATSGGASFRPIVAPSPAASITDYFLANGAVTTLKIADGNVTQEKLEPEVSDVIDEVIEARGGEASLDDRLDAIAEATIHRLIVNTALSTASAYVCQSVPPMVELSANAYSVFSPHVDNEAEPTIKIDDHPPKPLVTTSGGTAPPGYYQHGANFMLAAQSDGATFRTITAPPPLGGVDTGHLADKAVTTAKINDLAVRTASLNNFAVTRAKLASDANNILVEVEKARGGYPVLDTRLDNMDAILAAQSEASETAVRAGLGIAFDRPGEEPQRFTANIGSGDIDEQIDLFPAWNADLLVPTDEGEAALMVNGAICAVRGRIPIDPSTIYRIKWKLRRSSNPADPASDAIVPGLAWYGESKGYLSKTTLAPLEVTTGDGWQTIITTISRAAGEGIALVAPTSARFVTPYVQTYGSEQQTQLLRIDHEVVQIAAAPDVNALEGRVDALEAIDAEDRLDALESGGGGGGGGGGGYLNIVDFGGVANGTADDTLALEAVSNAGVAQGKTVLIRNGQHVRVTSDVTLGANFAFERGGWLDLDVAVVALAVNGSITAGDESIFHGLGQVYGGTFGGQPVKLEWFGVPKDGTTAGDEDIVEAIYAAAYAGVLLEGVPGRVYVFANPNWRIGPLEGAKLLCWRNIELYSASNTNGPILDIRPDTGLALATLSVDALVGDHGCTVGSDANLVVGRRYCLISKAFYYSATSANYCNKSEYVTLQSMSSGALTFYNYLRANFLAADEPTLFDATWDHLVDFENVTVRRSGGIVTRDGIYFTFCKIKRMRNCSGYATGVYAYQFKCCSFDGAVDGQCFDAPSGYGFGAGGCDQPKFGYITGRRMRHLLTVNGDRPLAGKSWSIGATLVSPTGRDGEGLWVHCDDAENSIFDMHPGHFGFQLGGVSGNVRSDAPAVGAVTLESPDISIGIIDVRGASPSIQFYGKGDDEAKAYYRFGSVRVFASPTTTSSVLVVQNRDAVFHQPIHIHADSLDGVCGQFLNLNCNVAGDEGGDILFTFGRMKGESRLSNTVTMTAGPYGKISCTGHRADLRLMAANVGNYCVIATGTAYLATHAGEHGAHFAIEEGHLFRVYPGSATNVLRSIDALIDIGRNVTYESDSGTCGLSLDSGVGGTVGSDKLQTTIMLDQAFTLTPRVDPAKVVINAMLTSNRICTLATGAGVARRGDRFHITRKAGTGAPNVDVGPGLKTLAAGSWTEVIYDDLLPGWFVSAFGTL